MLRGMYEPSVEEIEFHLATLVVELRALFRIASSASRSLWIHTVMPIIAHASGVCFALEAILDGEDARLAKALAIAITSLQPPEKNAEAVSNDDAWRAIRAAHADLAKRFVGRGLKPWVLAGEG
jgi:hypothetical protein